MSEVPLRSYCLGLCGRNTSDNKGTWMVVDIDGGDGYWCKSCWHGRGGEQDGDTVRGLWVQPDW